MAGPERVTAIGRPTLHGSLVRLEPLAVEHLDALEAATAGDRSTFGFTSVPDGRAALEAQVHELLVERDRAETLPFVQVRVADDRVAGMTRLMRLWFRRGALLPYSVEIGGTWLAADAQRTGLNREAKLLLLTHAFDAWGVQRVQLVTDARNERSQRAIAGIGATFEGILRSWQPSLVPGEESLLRDSAIFSILVEEWPLIRTALGAA